MVAFAQKEEIMPYALTIRLSDQVYRAAKNIASERGISINRLVQEAIAEKAEKELETRLKQAYDLLAADQEDSAVVNNAL